MGLMDGLKAIGEIHNLVAEGDWGKIECSDLLVGALGVGILAVIGGTIYQHGDKFGEWIKAARGKDGKVDEDKLRDLLKEYEKCSAKF